MIRILLADDQALVRGGFRLTLDAEPDMEVVGEASDGEAAVDRATETRPDLVLMDIRMPTLDGIAATRRLLAEVPTARVLILTTFDLDEYVVDAFRAGASGFLLKTAPPQHRSGRRRPPHSREHAAADRTGRTPTGECARARAVDGARARRPPASGARPHQRRDPEGTRRRALNRKSHVASLLSKLDLRDRVHEVVFAYESGLISPGA